MTQARAPFEEQITRLRAVVEDMSFPTVKDWKASHPGGKVVGMFPVYTPHELPHALGMLPVGIYGAGGRIEIDHADSRIQSFVCSIARSTLELGLTNSLKDFDGIYFTSICDVARNLSGVWELNCPQHLVEYIHFPQNVTSPSAVIHYVHELRRLASHLEMLTGNKLEDAALSRSITAYNHNREWCARIYEIKRQTPWLLSTYEAYMLLRIGTLIPVEEHSQLLKDMIPQILARDVKPRDYVRVVLEGSFCEQPPLELLQVIEEAGCYIVNDDLLLQTRWFDAPVPTNGNPFQALAESYLRQSVSSSVRHYGDRSRKQQFFDKVVAANADGVIFCAPKFCEPALLDYVLFKEDLERRKVACIAFEYEEKMGVFETIRMQVESFVESVMFFS